MARRFSRRETLLQTLAMTGAGALTGRLPPIAASPLPPRATNRDIDAALQAGVDAGLAPGVVAMAATETSVIYQGAFGRRASNGTVAMSMDTVFRIASMIKVLTSVAAMQLVEQGKLGLDEPAAKIDPALSSPQVLAGFNAKGVPELRPARQPITLRHLLTHTSGFSYPLWDANVVRYLKCARGNRALPHTPLMFDPGARWAYGGSLDRVGKMMEIASGKTLDRYFHDHILGPLEMKDTGFVITEDQHARQASLHVRRADGGLEPQVLERPRVPKVFSGGGGIYSTAPDYLRLLQALLGGGRIGEVRILRPETVALMGKNQIGNLEAGILKTTNPALSNDVNFFPGVRLRWGLGHMINLDPGADGRGRGSLTWAGLFNTYYWIDPDAQIAAVIMMQVLPFADRPALKVYRQFERGVYKAFKPA